MTTPGRIARDEMPALVLTCLAALSTASYALVQLIGDAPLLCRYDTLGQPISAMPVSADWCGRGYE